jgi:3'-phosphoadenosine 5'-phosphosulfate sulfotransferase (PAPS reductase)/FAD synthetase
MTTPFRPPDGALPDVALDACLTAAISQEAIIVFSLSGGKDSAAAAHAVSRYLDCIGHPKSRRFAIHADLGRAEWETTPAMVESIAAHVGVPLLVVRRRAGDMVARWEQRFANAKLRYEALSTYALIGPWSQANKRFCTSELKAQVIGPELARRFRGQTIISVVGIRRDESASRRSAPISALDTRFAKPGNPYGTRMLTWHPLADWPTGAVFAAHAHFGIPLHEAYTCYGSTRLSCRFCVLASLHDLAASTAAPANLDHYLHLVAMEADSTFSFQPGRWLADVAPHLLPGALARDIEQSKRDAAQRRSLEAGMPPALRFVKGWPPRAPTIDEAKRIAAARAPILARHGLADLYPDSLAVIARFAELLAAKRAPRATRSFASGEEEGVWRVPD